MQASPAYSNGKVYTGGAYDNKIYAIDATKGTETWSFPAGTGPDIGFVSAPAITGNVIYAGSRDDKLYALDATSGTLLWTYQTNGHGYLLQLL